MNNFNPRHVQRGNFLYARVKVQLYNNQWGCLLNVQYSCYHGDMHTALLFIN